MLSYRLRSLIMLIPILQTFLISCKPQEAHIKSALYSSAIGDALGRVTEFIGSTEDQFKRYPGGIKTFKDFKNDDWKNIPEQFRLKKIAPYTDDTAMALLVIDVLISARSRWLGIELTMGEIADAFVEDMKDREYGWTAGFRAPGNGCLKAMNILKHNTPSDKFFHRRWWDVNAIETGGCGSVMRAFPFGLIFADNPTKAKLWAVEHSKITHSAPSALAACAAMALGTAEALNGKKDSQTIITLMIEAAEEYDTVTAQKMAKAVSYALQAQDLLKQFNGSITTAMSSPEFLKHHNKVFTEFQGWSAQDAIAATVYLFALFPQDVSSALYAGVHTPGDSDSIAAMSGALIGAFSGSMPDQSMVDSVEGSQRLGALSSQIYINFYGDRGDRIICIDF